MKNKKGFTMIEILGAIIIMGVLLLLIIPGISKLMAKFRNDYYEKTEDSVNEAGKDFFLDNKIYLPDGLLESTYVNISSLINGKYLEELVDYRGNSCSLEDKESYVIAINRGDGKYEYKTCISCKDDGYETDKNGTYCDSVWLDEGTIDYAYCTYTDEKEGQPNECNPDLYFYYGTSREDIREELFKQLSVVRKDGNNEIIDSIRVADTKEEAILPTNIDIINNKPTLTITNNYKTFNMKYGNSLNNNVNNENKVTIYKHKPPMVTMTAGGVSYDSGDWTNQNVVITLKQNDEFFSLTGTSVAEYQYSVNKGNWTNVPCGMTGSDNSCSFTVSGSHVENSYKFRLITNEGNMSFESDRYYYVNIDKIDPWVSLSITDGEIKTKTDAEGNLLCKDGVCETEIIPGCAYVDAGDDESGLWYVDGIGEGETCFTSETYIEVCPVDYAGNWGYCESGTVSIIDNTITPEPPIEPDPPVDPGVTPDPGPTTPVEPTTYTIYYDGSGDSGSVSSTTCTVDVPCPLAENTFTMASYHPNRGWKNSSGTTSYSGGQSVTNLASAGGSITLYSYYECGDNGRTQDIDRSVSFNTNVWPFNLAIWDEDGETVLSYKDHYGCTSQGSNQTCFYAGSDWKAYGITCQYCGKKQYGWWCPVHTGDSKEVCDAEKGVFTGSECRK